MLTKLTLNADRKIVQKAKKLAREQRTSVSGLFDRFVRSVTSDSGTRPVGRLTVKATAVIALPRASRSDRQLLEDALLERHGL